MIFSAATSHASEPDGDEDTYSTITLSDGQRLVGRVIEEGEVYRIELSSGAVLELPAGAIESIEKANGPAHARDTHRVAYLFSPSGMMLREGEGYLAQRELIYTAFGYGITDFLTAELGTALPLWFAPPFGLSFNMAAGLKVGGNPVGDLHTSVAAQGIFSIGERSGSFGAALLSGNVTYGDSGAHVSVNMGVPLTGERNAQRIITTTLSGYLELNDTFGGVTEHWLTFSPDAQGAFMFNALGGRFTPGDFAIDVGLLFVSNLRRGEIEVAPLPLPWLNVVWGFGG